MVKKLQKTTSASSSHAQLSGSVKDSAQQIWQAGLGAFTRAQAEGSKAFESLVKEGVSNSARPRPQRKRKFPRPPTRCPTWPLTFLPRPRANGTS